jgi:hypothetical protein
MPGAVKSGLHPKALRDLVAAGGFRLVVDNLPPELRTFYTILFVEAALVYLFETEKPEVVAGHLYRLSDYAATLPHDQD